MTPTEQRDENLMSLIGDIRVDIATLPEKLLEKTDKRYAPMWAATAWKTVFTIVGGTVIVSVLALIIKAGL